MKKQSYEIFSKMELNKQEIIDYCTKYKIPIPEKEEVFWAGVHKTIYQLFLLKDSPISEERFNKSCQWLIKHGYTLGIKGGDKD